MGTKKGPPKGALFRLLAGSEKHADAGHAHNPVATTFGLDGFHAGMVSQVVSALAARHQWDFARGFVCVHTPTLVHLRPLVK